jgi:hypothetical protein
MDDGWVGGWVYGYKDGLLDELDEWEPPEPDPRYLRGPKKQGVARTFSWAEQCGSEVSARVGCEHGSAQTCCLDHSHWGPLANLPQGHRQLLIYTKANAN